MKTADEMRTVATRVQEEEQARVRNRSLDVLKNRIAPQIEMAANEGKMYIKYVIHMDAEVDTKIIADELRKIGYEVEYLGLTIEICW